MPHSNRLQIAGCLTLLLAAYAPLCIAQAGDCTAEVAVTPLGLQKPIDDTRQPARQVTLARYRLDATSNEKQCVIVNFNLRHGYKNKDGTLVTAAEPRTMRFAGGKGTLRGELALRRELPKLSWSAEDVSCKLCR